MSDTELIESFSSGAEWRTWLTQNHTKPEGIWLRFFKKDSGKKTFIYGEALDEALCFGWIDGQSNTYDNESWIQKFTPRRKRSMWSKRNREHVARLIKEGRMTPAGLKEIDAAKQDGRWDSAYDSPKDMKLPDDFLEQLQKNKQAYEFFKTLNRTNIYAIGWRLQTAKKLETRERRMKVILDMLSSKKKFH